MRLIFLHTFLVCSISNIVCGTQYLKPSFFPYCTTRDKCLIDCSCEILKECTVMEFDDPTRQTILNYLNELRDIQSAGEPVPGGLAMLQYDEQLEEISKCSAAKCSNVSSECFITPKFEETSQAITHISTESRQCPRGGPAKSTTTTSHVVKRYAWSRYRTATTKKPIPVLPMEMILDWMKEVPKLSVELLSDIPAGEEGEKMHKFAQVLSDRVLSVGCAWSTTFQAVTFVCTFGPRGPIQGEPIFRLGELCSLCPDNYACDHEKPFSRLCKEVPRPIVQTPPAPPPVAQQPEVTPPQPPPKAETPPLATPVPTPPRLPEVPPTPPPRRTHTCPPSVPPILPRRHPIDTNLQRMPPYLPQYTSRPCWVYHRRGESSDLIQLPGGTFDNAEISSSSQINSDHASPVVTPPPRSLQHRPRKVKDTSVVAQESRGSFKRSLIFP